jgi:hypothetical protein
MAKRRQKSEQNYKIYNFVTENKTLVRNLLWAFVIIVCVLFGYSYGYPLVAQGQIIKGILTGLAYGGGAFAAILVSFFFNRKLKGN